jgi:hypothetical protein
MTSNIERCIAQLEQRTGTGNESHHVVRLIVSEADEPQAVERYFATHPETPEYAWNKLVDRPWMIMSIGKRQWAHRS